jgi:hypothetical protein
MGYGRITMPMTEPHDRERNVMQLTNAELSATEDALLDACDAAGTPEEYEVVEGALLIVMHELTERLFHGN